MTPVWLRVVGALVRLALLVVALALSAVFVTRGGLFETDASS